MADTYFVSKISTSASGAVGVAFSLMAIIQAIGFTLGIGSGNYISRLLGAKDREYASKVAATGFFTALLLGAILAVIGLIFLEPLVYALGATKTIAPYAKAYVGYILIGMPIMAASFVLNNTLRFQGSAFYGMLGIAAGGLLNIALDPIFIFVLDMGEPVKIAELARDLIVLSGLQPDVDIKIKYTGLRPGEKLYEELLMDEVALTSTEHKKIFVEKPIEHNVKFLEDSIKDFREVIKKDDEQIFKLMQEKVPTYIRKGI
jgi:hypothetical protein